MDFFKKNLFIVLVSLYGLLLVKASTPGFDMKVGKSWVTDNVSYTQFDGEIVNDSKLKLSNWRIEIPYDKSKNKLHGNWGCEIEEQDDKIILTGGKNNDVIKVSTTATFGLIVSNPGSNFDIEGAILYVKSKEVPVHTKADNTDEDTVDMNADLPPEDNRYYLESMDIDELKAAASALKISEVKRIIFKELVEHWDVIKKYLRNDNMLKVYALFLGWATRESTLNAGVETAFEDGFGVNSAHAYGPFQTAVTAFYGCDPKFDLEDDVKELYWYTLTDKNFCDPYISTHMGIRKLIHFVMEAEGFGVTGIDIIRSALKGFNSGHADPMQDNKFQGYCDEIGALGHWYYETKHFEDEEYTWTGDSRCDRTDPWSWWLNDDPLPEVKIPVYVRNPEDGSVAKYTVDTYPTASSNAPSPTKPTTTTAASKPTSKTEKCWSQKLATPYPCCKGCEIYYTDDDGNWGVENDDWCGIIDKNCKGSSAKVTCFSENLEYPYPCCDNCEVYTTDEDGDWGEKNGDWCGIPDRCYK